MMNRAKRFRNVLNSILPAVFLLISACSGPVRNQADEQAGPSASAAEFMGNPIVQQKGCLTCHSIAEKGGTVGPALDRVANRRTQDWLRRWLTNPNDVKNGTKMPNFQFSEQELQSLLAVLVNLKKEFDAGAILAGSGTPAEKGGRLFESYDCYACHRIGSRGRFIGPNLTWLGKRKSPDWEKNWLKDPGAMKPGTFMPNFNLPPKEIDALAAFVTSQAGQKNSDARHWEDNTAFFLDSRPREIGEMVYRRFGCDGCHGQKAEGGYANPNAVPDEQMPNLIRVARKMNREELSVFLMDGKQPQKLDRNGPQPLNCPSWKNAMSESEAGSIYDFLLSIAPKKKKFKFGG